jgi:hypothetical protein
MAAFTDVPPQIAVFGGEEAQAKCEAPKNYAA